MTSIPPSSWTATPRKASIPSLPKPSTSSPLRPSSPIASPTPTTAGFTNSTPKRTSLSANSSPSGTPAPRSGTRARDLLRKHYGLGVGPPAPLSGPARADDPMDLDSPAFDAKAYYEQLITTSSLPLLLKRENDLLQEIRQLDSERQSLVYNHHHDLIAASDTIAAMKTRAESLDADLDALREAFSEISRLGAEVGVEPPSTRTDA